MSLQQIRLTNVYPTKEGSYFLVLEEILSTKQFGIITFQSEASYILTFFFQKEPPRPSLYKVFSDYITKKGDKIQSIAITKFQNSIYYAELLCVSPDGQEEKLDIRATDAIALAYLNKLPIYAESSVIEVCSEKFKPVIDQLKSAHQESLIQSKKENLITQEEDLDQQIQRAIELENYELAAELKKEKEKRAQ